MSAALAETWASPRLLPWPQAAGAREDLASHAGRLGWRPRFLPADRERLLAELAASGLLGRGGAGFPVAAKWRSVARRAGGRGAGVVLVNAAEADPFTRKDAALLLRHPHLVLDGAATAAEALAAGSVVFAVGEHLGGAAGSLLEALRERALAGLAEPPCRVAAVPSRFVAGQETALVRWLDHGDARPLPGPAPYEKGIGGRPTLVQNVETLAHAALIARFGAAWFRAAGTGAQPGTALLTIDGAVNRPGVYEAELGLPLGQAVEELAGHAARPAAYLVGGAAGEWCDPRGPAATALHVGATPGTGPALGTGAVAVLPEGACGVLETARLLRFLADQGAGQCGPCRLGLAAIAAESYQLAHGRASGFAPARLERWAAQVDGRGACRHPDGAVRLLRSALRTFGADFQEHAAGRPCAAARLHHGHLPRPAYGVL